MNSRRSERGSSMLVALLTLFFTASMAAVVLDRQDSLRNATKLDSVEIRARYAAEGGIERARWELARNAQWAGDTFELNGVRVTISVEKDRIVATALPALARVEAPRRR